MQLKGKKVLMMGLGLLGGGVSTTNWLLDRGAEVTVTDLKSEKALAASVAKVHAHIKKSSSDGAAYEETLTRLKWALGGHTEQMIRDADIVMVNPDVPKSSKYLRLAAKLGKSIVNEAGIFYGLWKGPTVGITGTRGKTTTAQWAGHLLNGSTKAIVTGNSLANPFLSGLRHNDNSVTAVTELPSFLLEHFDSAPDIAVVTNLYRDHLNRYSGLLDYARTKGQVFVHQSKSNHLILNADDEWTKYYLDSNPKSHVWLVSSRALKKGDGLYEEGGWLWYLKDGMAKRVIALKEFDREHGAHNVTNFMTAALTAHLAGCPWDVIASRMKKLPIIPYRQEVIYKSGKLTVINDTCATSPEGAMAALERFGGPNCILIAGGTDRDLDYRAWAPVLSKSIKPINTFFQQGTATTKMLKALGKNRQGRRAYGTLEQCVAKALKRAGKYVNSVVLFSPGAKSFGPFKNEYDRGQQFNKLVKNLT